MSKLHEFMRETTTEKTTAGCCSSTNNKKHASALNPKPKICSYEL